jgi:pimeloyl-ACP methyl ester carboxylesterase
MQTPVPITPSEGFVRTKGSRIHYLDWGGAGPPAHLLHANGFCAGTYEPFIRYLLDDFHLYASDVRGHGDSVRLDHRRIRHWRVFAEDLHRLVTQVMRPPVIGIGHSLGAVTTYIAAADYPGLFSAVILIDPVILPRRTLWSIFLLKLLGLKGRFPLAHGARRRRRIFQGKAEALRRFTSGRGIFKTWSKEFVAAYLECGLLEKDPDSAVLKCDPELEAQIFESIPLDVWRYAARIQCPVLALRGEHSETFVPAAAERLKGRIRDYELRTVSGAGHFIPMEKPAECAAAIVTFVRKTAALHHSA